MTPAVILGALSLLEAILSRTPDIIEHINQSSEWTPEQKAEFHSRIARLKAAPQWQVEPDPVTQAGNGMPT